ncbi:MAG: site-specific DNA-methyltransferase [Gallionella sp.]|nr:site-specific DNA-methyltransferase [Gallionella sp.]
MTAPSPQQAKLQNLLRELFQLDQPDLDFGLYRIMHAKSVEIENFIEHDLLDTIRQKLGGNKEEKIAQAKAAYERERQNSIDYGGNPDAPKVQQALAKYKVAQESQDDDAELFDHLYKFFERYYEGGDFLSRRYYARETSEKAAPYAVPYDGSEVYLHWANKDQYYIKTTESFRQFSVDLAQAKTGDVQLFTNNTPRKLHFTVVEAEEGAHNNVKASSDKDRYFILDADAPIEWQGDELTVRFHYRADPDKTGQAGKWREARNTINKQGLLDALAQQAQGTDTQAQLAQHFHHALASEIPKGKSGDMQTLLAKYLNQYTAKNSMDYFIHKNLGAFLKRELDFYIKNELFRLDDLGNADAPNPQQLDKLLKKALTLRDVAHKLIAFLAQTEEFQKKLWLKKKFVVDTQWLATLDNVPVSLYSQIEANDAQWQEWEKLGFVAADVKRKELLKPESKLVLDTQFFDADFTAQLLASTPNLDEATDGVLVHSENFQALNLMQARYREQVKCIYIDPPYNTSASEIAYKNSYKHSSWLALIQDRVNLGTCLMKDEGVLSVAIDDAEFCRMHVLLLDIFGEDNHLATVAVRAKPQGRAMAVGFSPNHEYADFFSKTSKASVGRLPRNEDRLARYAESDDAGMFAWSNFRGTGANSFRKDRQKLYYPIWINPTNGEIFIPSFEWSETGGKWIPALSPQLEYIPVYPMDSDNTERVWTMGWERAQKVAGSELLAKQSNGKWQIHRKYRPNQEGVLPGTWWADPKYSASESGTKVLQDILGDASVFSYPKSIFTVEDCIRSAGVRSSDCVLDFFGGSGTTGHAVINLNREDNGSRKYLLVEMGDYFNSVTKPRIAKVIYSADWKDGKPTAPETGISQLVRVIRLESYEDTINNLQVKEQSAQQEVIMANPALRESYFLHYLLELETQGSPSLLNIAAFTDPTAYTLNIKKPGSDVQERRAVDLLETFNWLLGLRVSKLHAPQIYTAKFVQVDAELPGDAQGRMVAKDFVGANLFARIEENRSNEFEPTKDVFWFRAVQGIVKGTGASAREQRVLVVWRKLTGNLEHDNLMLEIYLREVLAFDVRQSQDAAPFDVVYVNGSHALPAMPLCEVRQLEEAFHRLMWDEQDV